MKQAKEIVGAPPKYGIAGFTLIEIIVCLAILSLLLVAAAFMHLDSVKRAQAVEGTIALAEVTRLESLRYAHTGTYSSDLNELGFQLPLPLKYTQLLVRVQKDAKGWSYTALAMPLDSRLSNTGGLVVAQTAGGKLLTNMPGTMNSGVTSACSFWGGWGSMEGGDIEGEETLSSTSSTGGSGSPCVGVKVVNHGKQ